MKKSFLLLICWLLTSNVTLGQPHQSNPSIVEEVEPIDIEVLFEYRNQMRVNSKTGDVDVRDVLKARQAANFLAQKNGQQKKAGINWESIGPTNVGGRTRAILVDKDNSQKLFAGSVSGGLFTSNDGGETWMDHPQNQDFNTLSVSAITQASNDDIYFGTGEFISGLEFGESKLGASKVPGGGMYKSTDGGVTFQLLESTVPTFTNSTLTNLDWVTVQDIEVSPTDVNRIYVATNRGLQISQDGGETWSKANGVPANVVAYDVIIVGDGKAHVVAGSRYYQAANGLDFDDEFTSSGFPGKFEISPGNKVIAMSPTDNDYLYIATMTGAGCLRKIWQSKNGGETWVIIGQGTSGSDHQGNLQLFDPMSNGLGCVGWYSMALTVDPTDRERIFLGSVTLWSWSPEDSWNQLDGGSAPYYISQNKHTLVFDPNDAEKLYIGSDGGLTRSTNAGGLFPTFQYINDGYTTAQLYGVAANLDASLIIGGTQGSGTVFFEPTGTSEFTDAPYITGMVGGFCEISKMNPLAVFAMGPNGRLKRTGSFAPPMASFFDQNADCNPDAGSGACNSDGELDGNPLYITPFVLWEDFVDNLVNGTQKTKLITGACDGRVWMSEGVLDFTTVPSWRQIGKFAGSRCVSALAFSNDGKIVYVGTTDGRMMSIDLSFETPVTNESVIAPEQYITDIDVDFNPNHIVVSLGEYGREQNVMESFNARSVNPTYQSMQYNLPLMPVYSITMNKYSPNSIIVGTELGIWEYDVAATTWTEENDQIGRVPVHNLQFEEQLLFVGCEVLYAATHGRGVYRTTDFTFPTCDTSIGVGIDNSSAGISSLELFPNPMQENSRLEFHLTKATELILKIFDYQGKVVHSESLGKRNIGGHSLTLEGRSLNLSGGIYLVSLEGEGQRLSRKLVIR